MTEIILGVGHQQVCRTYSLRQKRSCIGLMDLRERSVCAARGSNWRRCGHRLTDRLSLSWRGSNCRGKRCTIESDCRAASGVLLSRRVRRNQEFHCKTTSAEEVQHALDEISAALPLPEVWHIEGTDYPHRTAQRRNPVREMVRFHQATFIVSGRGTCVSHRQ